MNNDDQKLIEAIVAGMQEQKAQNIAIVDMTKLDAPCSYFVICEGNSSRQVESIADTMSDYKTETVCIRWLRQCRMDCHRLRLGDSAYF